MLVKTGIDNDVLKNFIDNVIAEITTPYTPLSKCVRHNYNLEYLTKKLHDIFKEKNIMGNEKCNCGNTPDHIKVGDTKYCKCHEGNEPDYKRLYAEAQAVLIVCNKQIDKQKKTINELKLVISTMVDNLNEITTINEENRQLILFLEDEKEHSKNQNKDWFSLRDEFNNVTKQKDLAEQGEQKLFLENANLKGQIDAFKYVLGGEGE